MQLHVCKVEFTNTSPLTFLVYECLNFLCLLHPSTDSGDRASGYTVLVLDHCVATKRMDPLAWVSLPHP